MIVTYISKNTSIISELLCYKKYTALLKKMKCSQAFFLVSVLCKVDIHLPGNFLGTQNVPTQPNSCFLSVDIRLGCKTPLFKKKKCSLPQLVKTHTHTKRCAMPAMHKHKKHATTHKNNVPHWLNYEGKIKSCCKMHWEKTQFNFSMWTQSFFICSLNSGFLVLRV